MQRPPIRPRITMKRLIAKPNQSETDSPKQELTTDQINLKNKMVKDTLNNASDVTTQMEQKKMTTSAPFMIPLNNGDIPEYNRINVFRYLITIPNCVHNVHTYSATTRDEMDMKSQCYIELEDYGVKYPVVAKSRLVYCSTCFKDELDILKKSEAKGSLNFYSDEESRASYSHAPVPSHVNESIPVQIDGENVWVNLSHPNLKLEDISGIKDAIIVKTQRKNFMQVFSLPPPFAVMTDTFHDFGTVTFLGTAAEGYDSKPFMISDEVEDFDDDMCQISDDEASNIYLAPIPLKIADKPKEKRTERPQSKVVINEEKNTVKIIENIEKISLKEEECPKNEINHVVTPKNVLNGDKSIIVTAESEVTIIDDLILNMTQVSDFAQNIRFFKTKYDIDVHVATYSFKDLSVNVVTPLDSQKQDIIIHDLHNQGYVVDNVKTVTICINDTIQHRWSFVVKANESKQTVPSQSLISYIEKHVVKNQDRDVSSVLNILEKSYVTNRLNCSIEDIVYNFEIESACKNISNRDIRFLFDIGFSNEWNHYGHDPNIHSKLMLSLLVNILHNSTIPSSKVIVTDNSVTITM